VPGGLADPAATLRRAARGLAFTWRSFWGGFGWLAIWPGTLYYALAAAMSAIAAAAVLIGLLAPRRLVDDPAAAGTLRVCAVAAVVAVAIAVAGSLAGAGPDRQPQGRYLLPALVPLALLAVALSDRLAPRRGPWALAAGMFALDLWAVLGVMWPAFRGP